MPADPTALEDAAFSVACIAGIAATLMKRIEDGSLTKAELAYAVDRLRNKAQVLAGCAEVLP